MEDNEFYLIQAMRDLNDDDMGDFELVDKIGYTLAIFNTSSNEIVAWSNRVYWDKSTAEINSANVQNRLDTSYEEQTGKNNHTMVVIISKLAKQLPE
ncbi:hypothetical protein HOS78_gp093 [Lactobacillus phage Bacchae]|uniref:Uncharacterized protein n=1 Tax=Lactobacillus phage Bacchae TaxID=2079429 RepID=A0A2K9VCV3_9CAUD|nr:hypothetical protein HOS78_gp093 [Lactobacillus phage Bacchae]AUV60029.1 hypothetical protein [Lactobacillus phage Bacchae]